MPISIRYTQETDAPYLKQWLMQPDVLRWYPLIDEREVDDAVRIWIGTAKSRAGFTALYHDAPCGMVVIYPNIYKKLAHQSLFSIIVDEHYRGKGVGSRLVQETIKMAKEDFQIELFHLEVYEANPARNLYKRMGFEEYGVDKDFIKEDGKYVAKICMQKIL
jgi:ribosomal protein S18 acetylase RimI-like enzyme